MPDQNSNHCEKCIHLKNHFCALRNEDIEIPSWTTCGNWNIDTLTPTGTMYSMVNEAKNKVIIHHIIPYFNGARVDTYKPNGVDNTFLGYRTIDDTIRVFEDVKEYISFYEKEQEKKKHFILGAIIGDTIGSVFEFNNFKSTDFHLFNKKTTFTDDSVLTLATMSSILNGTSYTKVYQAFGRNYPNRGYGGNFLYWIYMDDPEPYGSFGNGSAMRVSPVGWAYDNLDKVLIEAERSAKVSHNHPEGIKGAKATASAIFLARTGKSKSEIKKFIETFFDYNLERTIQEIRPGYRFNVTCQGSVPEAIIAFLESTDFESAIRLAISLGGDSDTIACITGGIAEAYYKEIPEYIVENTLKLLPEEFIKLIVEFSSKYGK
jgi:ADP-ribosyl-[dinitrogen reductase] hydrolase